MYLGDVPSPRMPASSASETFLGSDCIPEGVTRIPRMETAVELFRFPASTTRSLNRKTPSVRHSQKKQQKILVLLSHWKLCILMRCQWPCPHPDIGTIKGFFLANFPLIFTVKATTGDGIYCFVCADFTNQLLASSNIHEFNEFSDLCLSWFFQTHQQSLITNLHPC